MPPRRILLIGPCAALSLLVLLPAAAAADPQPSDGVCVGTFCAPDAAPAPATETTTETTHECVDPGGGPPGLDLPEGADVADLTHEQALEGLEHHVVPGRVTVFDFHATWCTPCHALGEHLVLRMSTGDPLSVRRIDVAEGAGPHVDALLEGVEGLPHVVVYGLDGEHIGSMSGFEPAALDAVLNQALR